MASRNLIQFVAEPPPELSLLCHWERLWETERVWVLPSRWGWMGRLGSAVRVKPADQRLSWLAVNRPCKQWRLCADQEPRGGKNSLDKTWTPAKKKQQQKSTKAAHDQCPPDLCTAFFSVVLLMLQLGLSKYLSMEEVPESSCTLWPSQTLPPASQLDLTSLSTVSTHSCPNVFSVLCILAEIRWSHWFYFPPKRKQTLFV